MNKGFHNPYLAARQEWLERYGGFIKSRNNWRLFAFICASVALVSVGGNLAQTMQHKVVPYVVQTDRLGRTIAVGKAESAQDVPARVIQAAIAQAISDWRTVTADFGLQERLIDRLSAHIVGAAKGVLRAWYAENSPYERAKDVLVKVEVDGVPLPVSSDSWRIEWREVVQNHSGVTLLTTSYEATVAITIKTPTTEKRIIENPMGVYLTDLSWSKLINQGASK